jgi:replicative DNA helicase
MSKLPPHSSEAERAIIGACLITPTMTIPQIQTAMPDAMAFYEVKNRTIWEKISSLPPDSVNLITVNQALKSEGITDGIEYLNKCESECASPAHASEWIQMVQDAFTKRKIIQVCAEASNAAYTETKATDLLDGIESSVLKIRPQQRASTDIKFLVGQAINQIESKMTNPDTLGGLPTGLIDLDKLTDGCHRGEFIVVAGFPSTGKTALAVNIAIENALNGEPVGIFSAEMRPVQLVVRALCSQARSNYHHLDEQDQAKLLPAVSRLGHAPIHIEAAHGMTVNQVMATARRLKQQHKIKMVVVDYIQLIQGVGDNREQQISSVSKGLKAMALELDVPVLGLSQLTDDGQLRESRAIGQDADSIWKLINDGEWQPKIQPVSLRVEKCRDGETGKVNLTFLKTFTHFECAAKIQSEDYPTA